MRPDLVLPPKVQPGDQVAVVSPSFAAPAKFAAVHELAMRRLRADLGVIPVEYPTTRRLDSAPQDRAADLMAAFADPEIKAVMSTIGGNDQITVLRHLDPAIMTATPKAFFGYSDNTNLLNWLWTHGVASYHGGSTMVHLGRGKLHPVSVGSLRSALLTGGDVELHPVESFSEDIIDWLSPAALEQEPPALPSPGWSWHQPDRVITAPTWGGNLEILHWNLAAGHWIRPVHDYAVCVLLLETSEDMPSDTEVFASLRNAGERGLLEQFPAILVGTAMASTPECPRSGPERERYRALQREAIQRALAAYNPDAMVVFGVDFGHTDPQWILPYGGTMTIDGPARRITAHY
jgi:muramoyltetrapeptide carboxypeptidase LdcA involved in peptidoglycan recycling